MPTTLSARRSNVRLRAAIAAVAVIPLAATALSGCSSNTSTASGAAGNTSADLCPNGQIRFGVEPFEDASKLIPAYQTLATSLSKKLNCPVKVQIVQQYSAEVLAMQNGQLEIGQFGPLGFVFASQRAKAVPVASFAGSDGKLSTYTAAIWVPKDSPITSVAELKGKSLALSDTGSTSGDAMPRFAMRQAGLKDSDVKLEYAGGHPQSMLALTNGKVDAAEVNSQQQTTATEAGTFDASRYRKIWTSQPIPNDPITIAGSVDPALQTAIKNGLLDLPTADVQKVGAELGVEPGPLVAVSKTTYQPLFDLASTLGLTEKDA